MPYEYILRGSVLTEGFTGGEYIRILDFVWSAALTHKLRASRLFAHGATTPSSRPEAGCAA